MKTEKLSVKQFTYPLPIQLTSFHHEDHHSFQRPDIHPHRHKYYEILFFKQASGLTHHLDSTRYAVTSGCLFFIAPRQVHFLTRAIPSYTFQIYAITFSDDFLAKVSAESGYTGMINELLAQGGALTLHQKNTVFETLWHQMQDEVQARKPGFENCIVNHFRNLIIYLTREQQPKCLPASNDQKEQAFHAFQQLVQQHYTQQWTVLQYAQALHKSSKQLGKLCNEVKGCSPQRYIHEQMNTEAKRYLSHSLLQIKEIAGILGFDDQAYFSRFFKRMNNESPEKYRGHMGQKAK
jgi:AraC-like DNA-binding protein